MIRIAVISSFLSISSPFLQNAPAGSGSEHARVQVMVFRAEEAEKQNFPVRKIDFLQIYNISFQKCESEFRVVPIFSMSGIPQMGFNCQHLHEAIYAVPHLFI